MNGMAREDGGAPQPFGPRHAQPESASVVAERDVLERLRGVIDPELGVGIVDLGLVYGVRIEEGIVWVRLTTTTVACPIGDYLVDGVRDALQGCAGIRGVQVELTHEPPWSPERMSIQAQLMLGWRG